MSSNDAGSSAHAAAHESTSASRRSQAARFAEDVDPEPDRVGLVEALGLEADRGGAERRIVAAGVARRPRHGLDPVAPEHAHDAGEGERRRRRRRLEVARATGQRCRGEHGDHEHRRSATAPPRSDVAPGPRPHHGALLGRRVAASASNGARAVGSASASRDAASSAGDAAEDPLDRHLQLLARQRPRDGRHRDDLVRDVARRELAPERRRRSGARSASSTEPPAARHDEQQQLARPAAGVLEMDDEAVRDLRQRLDDRRRTRPSRCARRRGSASRRSGR